MSSSPFLFPKKWSAAWYNGRKRMEEDWRLIDDVKNMFLDIAAAVHGFFYGFLVIGIASAVIGMIIYVGIVGYTMIF